MEKRVNTEKKEVMQKYPRQCARCERFYKSQPSFSRHKGKCFQYAVEYQVEQKRIEDATLQATLTINTISADTQAELQRQLNELTRELEIMKVQQNKSERKVPFGFSSGHAIYLAQTRDCFDRDNNVFKIGRTVDIFKRRSGYPKGTVFFLHRLCLNAQEMESRILNKAASLYKRRRDYGNEYFEADLSALIDLINDEMNAERKKPQVEEMSYMQITDKQEVEENQNEKESTVTE